MIKQYVTTFLLSVFFVIGIQNSALAYDINFVNYSGHKIDAIYIFDDEKWVKLGSSYSSSPIHDGKSASFYFSKVSSNASIWDIKVEFSNGDFVKLTKVDLYTYKRLTLCQDSNSHSGFCLYVEKS